MVWGPEGGEGPQEGWGGAHTECLLKPFWYLRISVQNCRKGWGRGVMLCTYV